MDVRWSRHSFLSSRNEGSISDGTLQGIYLHVPHPYDGIESTNAWCSTRQTGAGLPSRTEYANQPHIVCIWYWNGLPLAIRSLDGTLYDAGKIYCPPLPLIREVSLDLNQWPQLNKHNFFPSSPTELIHTGPASSVSLETSPRELRMSLGLWNRWRH